MTYRVLDAYSCTGIYADGLTAAGADVFCIDNDPAALRHNPHPHALGDALKLLADKGFLAQFDAIHASPPCQAHSATRKLADAQGRGTGRAIDLLPQTMTLLRRSGLPWVIENVNRSPLRFHPNRARLCGSSFGLKVERHRWFVSEDFDLTGTVCAHRSAFDVDPISHKPRPWGIYYAQGDNIPSGGRTATSLEHGHAVMGLTKRQVPWKYLCESLPPTYGLHIGAQMMAQR
jgi:DNA (cytosine-5)-methyltransferase 1